MALIALENPGQAGIVKDIAPWQLPANIWSSGNNVRTDQGAIKKVLGWSSIIETVPVAPYHLRYLESGVNKFWIAAGLAAVHVYDSTGTTTALNGAIDDSVTTVTVTSNAGFESAGTISIEDEQITYTGLSGTTQFTGCTRGANSTTAAAHADTLTVTRTKKWYDITRASGAYNATATEGWTSTVLGGVLVLAQSNDDPQFWALTSGVPTTGTKLADLTNWPASTEAASVKSFRSFLFALNVSESSVNYPDKVRWSSEAATQTVPGTWSESDATQDAGSYHLADTPGKILDGLPLRDSFFIYKDDSVYAANFVGTPYIFSFRQVSPTIGALASNCVVEFDGGHAIFGRGNLYVNDGQRIKSILPHKMREFVFTEIDGSHVKKAFTVADYARNEILFCFVSTSSSTNQVDKAVIWNYVENTFSVRDLPDLAHIGYGVAEDESALTTWSSAVSTWSSVTGAWAMSWDKVENVLLFASPSSTKIYRDNVGNKSGTSNMTSFIERTGLSTTAGGQPDQTVVKRINAVWPKMSIDNSSSINVYVGTQMSTEDPVTWVGPYSFNPDSQSKVSCRASGKLYGIKFESTTDMNWVLNGVEIEVEDAGRRGSRSY